MDFDLKEAMDYYARQGAPGDQMALINLLKELGGAFGGVISRAQLNEIAGEYKIKANMLEALLKRIKSLRLSESHILEICCGPNCPKRAALWDYASKKYGKTAPRLILRQRGCMRMCAKGPNIVFDGKVYSGADEALVDKLIKEI